MIDMLFGHLFTPGGPILLALAAISVGALTVTLFKIVQFSQMGVGQVRGANAALGMWAEGNLTSAIRQAKAETSPTANAILEAMVSLVYFPQDKDRARDVAAHSAMETLNALSKNLRFLETVAQAAPMLGLLGTVVGMISAFGELSAKGGAIDPSALAAGIWVALIATAAGLSVGIPVYFVSMWFESRVDHERAVMEAAIAKVLFSIAPAADDDVTQTRPSFGQTVPAGR